jgi:zinc transport system substrate-binding protein
MFAQSINPKTKIFIVLGIIFLITFVSILLLQYRTNANKEALDPNKLHVSTSFYPLYYFTQQVGGDKVEVKNITPVGSEPHDYEPTNSQIQDIYKSNLFVFNGAEFDPWATKLQENLTQQGVATLAMSTKIKTLKSSDTSSTSVDPHFWLSPMLASKEAQLIGDELVLADPTNKELYSNNTTKLVAKLTNLHDEYKTKLTNCGKREIVTSHDFMQYVGKEYGFGIVPVNGLSPDSEPSSKTIAEITKLNPKNIILTITTAPPLGNPK